MVNDQFKSAIRRYLVEAGEAPPPGDAPQDAGAAPVGDPAGGGDIAGGDPSGGGMPSMDGGGLGGLGGGMPGGGMDPMGGDQGGQQPGGQNNDLCSKKYVALVSYLCELYNIDVSSKKTTVLNLKVKVGEVRMLNDVHNADEVFHFMVDTFLEDDVIESVKKNIKKADKTIKKIKSSGETQGMMIHNSTSAFLIDVVTCAYYAVCMKAIGEDIPDINYGITKDFPVDPKNAKAVFDEIKMNVDRANKLSEIEEG